MVNIQELNEDLELTIETTVKKAQENGCTTINEIQFPIKASVLMNELENLEQNGDIDSRNELLSFIKEEAKNRLSHKISQPSNQLRELTLVEGHSALSVQKANECINKLTFKEELPSRFYVTLIDLLEKTNGIDFLTGVVSSLEHLSDSIDVLAVDMSTLSEYYSKNK